MAFTQQFFTADSHFGHQLMLRFRPFQTTDKMDEHLIDSWNVVVKPHDIVWHLGDFSCHDEARTKQIFDRLQGRKRLILGNHDVHADGQPRKSIRGLAWDQPPTSYAETKINSERISVGSCWLSTPQSADTMKSNFGNASAATRSQSSTRDQWLQLTRSSAMRSLQRSR